MPIVQVGEVELFYELRRKADSPVLMLVCGLSSQLITWDDELCEMFEDAGFSLLLFDIATWVDLVRARSGREPSRVIRLRIRSLVCPLFADGHGRRRSPGCSRPSGSMQHTL